jgi:molybdenum cofactor synthesis domain-containing protein
MPPTAAILIIGNEILSGRTQDINLNFLAKELTGLGIRLAEARVIPDIESVIVETLNAVRRKYTYVFTTGGIGPTHDDITSECVAKAFGIPYGRHKEAEKLLLGFYKPEMINAARMKMADMPLTAELITNAVSVAPGFRVENVYVMAGVPNIMRAMWDGIKPTLQGGPPVRARTLVIGLGEGTVAEEFGALQKRYPEVDMGSYPFVRNNSFGTSLVLRSADTARLDAAFEELKTYIASLTQDYAEE